jgi:CelD/BcsL family acetyltransferase involved in cellulose biosynthesis
VKQDGTDKGKAYRVVQVLSTEQWKEHARAWNELLRQSKADTVFLTWEWLYSWAETYAAPDRELFILMVYWEDELVGIAPWYLRHFRQGGLPVRQIQFLGTPEAGSDYLDVIIRKGQEQKVTLFLYDYLLHEVPGQWDSCVFQDLSSNSLFLLHLLSKIEDDGKYAELRPGSFCPIVSLPQKGQDLFSLYSAHRRLQFRRHLKVLRNEGPLQHDTSSGEDAPRALKAFCDLYEAKNEKHDPTVRPLLLNYAARCNGNGTLQVDLLRSQGNLIAGMLHFKYQNTLGMYLMAVDKDFHQHISLGNIFVGLCLSNAIDDGIVLYDFLKGTEPYKFHWADGGRSAVTFSYYQKKIAPLMMVTKKFLTYTAKAMLR